MHVERETPTIQINSIEMANDYREKLFPHEMKEELITYPDFLKIFLSLTNVHDSPVVDFSRVR